MLLEPCVATETSDFSMNQDLNLAISNGLGFEIVGTWQCIIQDFLIYDSRLNSFFFLGPSHRFGGHHYMHLLTSSSLLSSFLSVSAIYSCHDAMFNAICQNHGITFSNAAASCKAFHQGIYGMATSTANEGNRPLPA